MKFSDMTCVFLLLIIWGQNFQQLQQVNASLQRIPRVNCARPVPRTELK